MAGRIPLHLWIVGGAATLWNGYGAYDYLMIQTRNGAYLAMFSEAQRTYFESFAASMETAWALGVWGGLAGSLLLLARSRYAVAAFGLSLAGVAGSTVYQYLLSPPPEDVIDGAMIAMTVAIWAVAIGLFVYAREVRAKGLLR
jgi:hypothetical protein